MQVSTTTFTVAEYCGQMKAKDIIVDTDYQRSDKVWPPSARSFLMDSLIQGYPMPKISLYPVTDLKSKKTVKYIVDGQQRSGAIFDFFSDKLRISGKSKFAGMLFSQLEESDQKHFLEYPISADIFNNATIEDIRQVFRRINAYTVPLNPQEQRHATFQGEFKWFIYELTDRYSEALKKMGVLTEKQINRMADGALLADIVLATLEGITTASKAKLDKLYEKYDDKFPAEAPTKKRLAEAIGLLLQWPEVHNGPLMKQFSFYSLCLAVSHLQAPLEPLQSLYEVNKKGTIDSDGALVRLTALGDAVENPPKKGFKAFIDASTEATNTKKNREIRFVWYCRALQGKPLP